MKFLWQFQCGVSAAVLGGFEEEYQRSRQQSQCGEHREHRERVVPGEHCTRKVSQLNTVIGTIAE